VEDGLAEEEVWALRDGFCIGGRIADGESFCPVPALPRGLDLVGRGEGRPAPSTATLLGWVEKTISEPTPFASTRPSITVVILVAVRIEL
jgi:hypothetical protein